MVDKFNFYDIYGNLIPGVILLIILTAPLAVYQQLPKESLNEFSALIVAVAVAYVIGHVLQSMATSATPSKFGGQYPSSRVLNKSDQTFSPEFKKELASKVSNDLQLELAIDQNYDEIADKVRVNAFLMIRDRTNAKKLAPYSEQYQGLYAMMRGLMITFAFGFFYYAGWATSYSRFPCLQTLAIALLAPCTLATVILAIIRTFQKADEFRKGLDRGALAALAGFLPAIRPKGSPATSCCVGSHLRTVILCPNTPVLAS